MDFTFKRIVGIIAAVTLVLPLVVSVVASLPDIMRYFRMRSM